MHNPTQVPGVVRRVRKMPISHKDISKGKTLGGYVAKQWLKGAKPFGKEA